MEWLEVEIRHNLRPLTLQQKRLGLAAVVPRDIDRLVGVICKVVKIQVDIIYHKCCEIVEVHGLLLSLFWISGSGSMQLRHGSFLRLVTYTSGPVL